MTASLPTIRCRVRPYIDPVNVDVKAWKFVYMQSKLLPFGLSRPDPLEV